ncbi:hypothetical protein BHE74_00016174 [Ensete ventricosum]|nr:hypothetical protein GW17_00019816 [Ensete ventricosum]RWW75768.1 hypothetical protein BHE74_00016174 [Ensete ventricosum]RZR93829.1 hypothetical protein BHM03_00022407 [Ensete ventricosum]
MAGFSFDVGRSSHSRDRSALRGHHPTPSYARSPASGGRSPYRDDDVSWQTSASWQFEPGRWRELSGFGAALSPWTPADDTPRSNHSRTIFRRSANDYYLSRAADPRFHGQSEQARRLELHSYVSTTNNDRRSVELSKPNNSSVLVSKGRWNPAESNSFDSQDEFSLFGYSATTAAARHNPVSSYIDHSSNHQKPHDVLFSHDREEHRGHDVSDNSRENDVDGDDEEAVPASRPVGLFSLFKYSTALDLFLIFLGCIGSLISGGSLPWYSYMFGDVVNKMASQSGNHMIKEVERVRACGL